jgi:Protein of unknown function (DUF4446)
MNVLSLVLALVALAVAVLALRRADVVESRARRWLEDRGAPPAPAAAGGGAGLNRIAVVRYDAFEDVGGRLSFSVAMLDERGTGLVLTAIHGRGETRSYVKEVPVPAGSGSRELSPEEAQAVATALRTRTS